MLRHTDEYPPRELQIALFERAPIEPRHDVPDDIGGGGGWEYAADDCDRLFFEHFDLFARAINNIYTPDGPWEGGPWRLQEMADTLIRRSGIDEYPVLGRRYEIFYNQGRLGILEIGAFLYEATKPSVHTIVKLEHVRLLPFDEVCGFLITLAGQVSAGSAEEYANAQNAIDRTLIGAVWQIGREGNDGGTIELHLHGSAANYLKYRQAVRDNAERSRLES